MIIMESRKGYEPVTIKIYIKNKGIVLEEISLAAIDKKTKKIIAIGAETIKIKDDSYPEQEILIVCPLRGGVIADYTISVKLFEALLQKAVGHKLSFRQKPTIAVCIPKETTEVECKAFSEAFYQIGAKQVFLSKDSLEETMLAYESENIIIIAMDTVYYNGGLSFGTVNQ